MPTTHAASITVRSPWDDREVGEVPLATAADVDRALASAAAALDEPLPQHERAAILERAAMWIEDHHDELADTICAEAGKPITAARVEAARAVDTMRESAIQARALTGETIPMDGTASGAGKLAFTVPRPIGVVAAISPFNFPLNLCCHKIGPAIAAGCPVVHKPASATPLSAVLLRRALLECGLPEQWYSITAGPGGEVGDRLAADPRVALITFTGSSAVGWALPARAPRARVKLELGNSTPVVVQADAQVDAAAAAIVNGGYGYAGQSCISVQRVIAHRDIHDELLDAVLARVAAIGVGDPAEDSTVVGPVIDAHSRERLLATFEGAAQDGARCVLGGGVRHDNLVEPTVFTGAAPGQELFDHELFGPAVCFTTFADSDEAVRLANATPYGLQGGVFAQDIDVALGIARQLRFSAVTVNESPTFRADQMPYGGIGESGNTHEGPRYAVREMLAPLLVVL
jgi:acyl-CoA reductase-like NAD-dependent aldehyde dehydrogenase